MDYENLSYEEATKKLEEIVRKMENGQLSLNDSIKAYEEGMKLLKHCEAELAKYETIIKNIAEPEAGENTEAN